MWTRNISWRFMYEQGLGVKTDFAAAAKWYHAAAEQGDAAAQMNIATLYEDGLDGLPQDYAAALKWYGAAFEQGEWDAANSLARLYAEGLGVPQDYAKSGAILAGRRRARRR